MLRGGGCGEGGDSKHSEAVGGAKDAGESAGDQSHLFFQAYLVCLERKITRNAPEKMSGYQNIPHLAQIRYTPIILPPCFIM